MISFIIIGKNESKTLGLCFNSILLATKHNNLTDFEIIYVDSKSTDNSIEIARSFGIIKIYAIHGVCNAAIARNIGAKESQGDILCFLDGDMEIDKDFISCVLKDNKLVYPFISGKLINIFYNNYSDWTEIDRNTWPADLDEDKYYKTTGGYFMIEKSLWIEIGGMKTKYKRSEDYDFGLRLSEKGILLLRKNCLMVTHHTIDYQNSQRIYKRLFNGSLLYPVCVLFRDHIFNIHMYPIFLRNNYTMILLIISILTSFYSIYFLLFYLFFAISRTLLQKQVKGSTSILSRIFYRISLDILSFWGFFLFFPKNHKLNYKKVN